MSGLRFHPEFQKAIEGLTLPEITFYKDVAELAETTNAFVLGWSSTLPRAEGFKEDDFTVKSYDGENITVTRHANQAIIDSPSPLPAVLHLYGGGMVAGSPQMWAPLIASYAVATGLPVFAVGYRLAPAHPDPTPVEDAFAALKYLSEHAAELNIDPTKIVVVGESAGGGLAAGLSLLARDRQFSPPIAKQVLVYPMLDDRTELPPEAPLNKFLNWTSRSNVLAWNAYIGEDKRARADADISPYASPGRVEDLSGLPPTYVDVGALDLFREEDIAFANRLLKNDVEVEFHLWPGVPHGFEGIHPTGTLSKSAIEMRMRAIKSVIQ